MYKINQLIDVQLIHSRVLLFYCKGYYLNDSDMPRKNTLKSYRPCPQCGNIDSNLYLSTDSVHYCPVCGLLFDTTSAHCLACGEYLLNSLYCDWCGQTWELDIIRSAYLSNDSEGMLHRYTPPMYNHPTSSDFNHTNGKYRKIVHFNEHKLEQVGSTLACPECNNLSPIVDYLNYRFTYCSFCHALYRFAEKE